MIDQRSVTFRAMQAFAKAGHRRVWLRDDLWCALAREVAGGIVEANYLLFGARLQVYPRCAKQQEGV